MDAFPVEDNTGLPYASQVMVKIDSGAMVPVMHACGHDVHMSSWYGAAKLMAANKERWHGTLILRAGQSGLVCHASVPYWQPSVSSWYGAAKLMAANKERWHGTLILIGQPAEE